MNKTFAVEYINAIGRLKTIRVEAPTADEAMHTAVAQLGIDYAAIQTTEERGA